MMTRCFCDQYQRYQRSLAEHLAYMLHITLQTVALSQLDSLRRELIACARDRLEFLVFTKVMHFSNHALA